MKFTEQCHSCGTSVTSMFPMMFNWMCNWVSFGRQLNTFWSSSFETAMRRFGSGVHISCSLFVSFSCGHYEIAATLSIHVLHGHSLPPDSKPLVSELTFVEVLTGNVIHPIKFRPYLIFIRWFRLYHSVTESNYFCFGARAQEVRRPISFLLQSL